MLLAALPAYALSPVWPPGNWGLNVASMPGYLMGAWCEYQDPDVQYDEDTRDFKRKRSNCSTDLTVTAHEYHEKFGEANLDCHIRRIEKAPDSTYPVVSTCKGFTGGPRVHTVHLAGDVLHWNLWQPPYN
jgi:hypothetical protein